jgi:hypothetical protein
MSDLICSSRMNNTRSWDNRSCVNSGRGHQIPPNAIVVSTGSKRSYSEIIRELQTRRHCLRSAACTPDPLLAHPICRLHTRSTAHTPDPPLAPQIRHSHPKSATRTSIRRWRLRSGARTADPQLAPPVRPSHGQCNHRMHKHTKRKSTCTPIVTKTPIQNNKRKTKCNHQKASEVQTTASESEWIKQGFQTKSIPYASMPKHPRFLHVYNSKVPIAPTSSLHFPPPFPDCSECRRHKIPKLLTVTEKWRSGNLQLAPPISKFKPILQQREDRLQKRMITKMGKKVRISRAKDNVTAEGSDQCTNKGFQRQ